MKINHSRTNYLVFVFLLLIKSFSTTNSENKTVHKKRSIEKYDMEHYSIIPLEFYEKIDEYELISMYNLIFDKIQFSNEYCNIAFQNCMANTNNNADIQRVSHECFPLKKARHCLHKSNFVDSDCNFRTVHEKVKMFISTLGKNLEACNSKFPTLKLNSDSSFLQSSSRLYSSCIQIIYSNFLILFLIFKFYQYL